ncbi:nucleotide exchange factor GrpE [Candidatus Nanohalobium constans]|uniref:Protein GrpE n=1 Tax=Candidatus Nanohalobium constans TaxID=2565781 RepID=A0A5Q0UEG6_9ARCH|nr:nucleotide exchange factor GrpE [Candidatus Nanohalobium constans]QGA79952.1 molecular chaperone GrpE [Candidatus Nanohalobium constans]
MYDELSREQLEEALQEMEKEAEELKDERDEWESKAKKIKADFENYKKKQDERKQKWQRRAEEKLAEDMIQIMDNLERAILSADEDSTIVKGVKMVSDQLYEELEKRGLERINAEGEEFDPNLHKAVDTREHEEERKILEQKRKGYMFDDKVLREAEVVVGENKK